MSEAPDQKDWVSVRVVASLVDAQLARGLLESEGLECYVHGEQHRSMLGLLGAYIEARLMVRGADRARAEQILADMDEANAHPEAVHYLCDVDVDGDGDGTGSRQELKDLDNLVLDLEALTLCTIGRDTRRGTIEAQLGEPRVDPGDDGVTLRYADLGAAFYLDEQDRLAGFLAVIETHPDYPDLEPYPGFWDPGSSLTPPRLKDLKQRFGDHPTPTRSGRLTEYEWELDTAVVSVDVDSRGRVLTFTVDFD